MRKGVWLAICRTYILELYLYFRVFSLSVLHFAVKEKNKVNINRDGIVTPATE